MLANERDGEGWRTPSGRSLSRAEVEEHLRFLLEGEFSSAETEYHSGFFEPMIRTHPVLAGLVPSGLPDIRLIRYHGEMLLAMVRLPTRLSGGPICTRRPRELP